MICQNLFCQCFVMRQHEAARIAAGKFLLFQNEITDDITVERGNAAKFFQQVECDMWIEIGQFLTNHTQIVPHADDLCVVSDVLQRGEHIKFAFPFEDFFVGKAFHAVRWQQVFVGQDKNSQGLHNAT